jgi:hypothetical protein
MPRYALAQIKSTNQGVVEFGELSNRSPRNLDYICIFIPPFSGEIFNFS